MSTCDLLTPKLPQQTPGSYKWGQLYGASLGLAIANTSKTHAGPILVITHDVLTAHKLQQELQFFAPNETVMIFPDWEILPYDSFSPHQDIISERLKILSQLPNLTKGILIVPITTCMYRLAPRDYLTTHSLVLKVDQKINLTTFRQQLEKNGYYYVNQVMNHGEFAIRGSIIDLFPMGITQPLRIDLFDDDIDSIRIFNPETQLSIEKIDSIELLPAHEFPLDESAIKLFTQNWQQHFRQDPTDCPTYQDICKGFYVAGSEFYLSLFFTKTASIFEYLPKNCLIIRDEKMIAQTKIFWDEINHRYEQLRHDIMHPILSPKEIFLTNEEIFAHINDFTQITTYQEPLKSGAGKYNFATEPPPSLTIQSQIKTTITAVATFY